MCQGEVFILTGANVGLDQDPGWYLNLKHNPQAQIQVGITKLNVSAEEITPVERERLWTDWIKSNPGYATFQAKTSRQFPMLILKPLHPS
jgi:deazaflavin-dependent oxidoreductase (nitroreductase family)